MAPRVTNLRKAALLRNICLWLIVAFVNKFTVNINQTQTICDCAASARSPLGCGGRSTLLTILNGFGMVLDDFFVCGMVRLLCSDKAKKVPTRHSQTNRWWLVG